MGGKLAQLMRNSIGGTWLQDFSPKHPALNGWNNQDRDELCRQLMPQVYYELQETWMEEPTDEVSCNVLSPQVALEKIYKWWEKEGRKTHLHIYINQLYPRGEPPNLKRDEDGKIDRRGWMTLISIGVFQRLGRIQDFQTRGFIETLEDKGWWQVFCEADPNDDGERWLQVLREFADDQVGDEAYSYWLDSFPRLFKVAMWLDAYVGIFEGINKRSLADMSSLLTPNADPVLQGSGIYAPPLNRTLRRGFNLVVRELLRQKILTNPDAAKYAYMPSKKLLRLLETLKLVGSWGKETTSPAIHSALCKILGDERAIFGGDYDIPLQILAKNDNSGLLWTVCQIDIEESDEDEDYYG
ncbi:MAG: hypothetical protein WCI11_20275 [Candidatus Methylumidiphilus sp.]